MDSELLRLKERVEIALEIGESYYREFKTALEGPPGKKTPGTPKRYVTTLQRLLLRSLMPMGGSYLWG